MQNIPFVECCSRGRSRILIRWAAVMDCGVSAVIVLASIIPAQRRNTPAHTHSKQLRRPETAGRFQGGSGVGVQLSEKHKCVAQREKNEKARKRGRVGEHGKRAGQVLEFSFGRHPVAAQNWILNPTLMRKKKLLSYKGLNEHPPTGCPPEFWELQFRFFWKGSSLEKI